ncbi:FIST signal transduction protein [uncultured Jatrophihabitans sp.]|uniref:FIST signal transduction protein n=1 Tax=uncultured Jatrophihabitans sp. TaxID=1610747 RepID=UPI0035CA0F7A
MTAATEALDRALAGREPTVLLVFCAPGYDLEALFARVCAGVPDDACIVGGSTNGELAAGADDAREPGWSPGVLVLAMGGPGFTAHAAVVREASSDRHAAGAAVAAALNAAGSAPAPHRVMFMLADGLTREQHELVRGAYSVLGLEVPIVGGCTGDDLDYAVTYQFHGTGAGVEVLSDSIVGLDLGSDQPMGIGIAHGWSKHGEPMMVTSSEGGEVQLLDGEPAIDCYLRAIGETRALLDDPDKFREVAFANPLGMSRRSGADVRVVHAVDRERGSVHCLADVPQGALVWPMTSDVDSLIGAAHESATAAIAELGDAQLLGLLVLDCGARKLRLGREHLAAEQAAFAEVACGKPFGGFYTFGEIARTQGSRGMHHFTVVTLALA